MNQYRRIVSYLYKYGNGKKGENTGFVRIDTRPEGIRIHFRIKDLRMMDERRLKVYFYFHKENRLQLVFVDEFLCVRGNCEYKKIVFPDLTDADFEKLNGVVFLDRDSLLYGSCWDEREISEDLFAEKEEVLELDIEKENYINESDKNRMTNQKNEIIEERGIEENRYSSETELEETAIEETSEETVIEPKGILSQFPPINLDGAEDSIQAARITLTDISLLPSREWPLAENVFLKQAYEKERHLLLGKIHMPGGNDTWVLGVPGTYDNREKYLAGIFGFGNYITVSSCYTHTHTYTHTQTHTRS